jgi:hypothetical protein
MNTQLGSPEAYCPELCESSSHPLPLQSWCLLLLWSPMAFLGASSMLSWLLYF